MSLDLSRVRSAFPALSDGGYIYADNAGGSQCLKSVADRMYDYLLNTNVQLGADYSASVVSTKRVTTEAFDSAKKLFNAESGDEIVFGSSTTMNMENLARAIEPSILKTDEFIITGEHEANNGPWKKLASRTGASIKYWKPSLTNPNNPYSVAFKISDLLPLITSNTRIIAFAAVSNILGTILPVKDVIKAAREDFVKKGGKAEKLEVSVDSVAYAPHRLIDVRDWDVDYTVFSFYKVYGPHLSALYVRSKALENSLKPIVHHFLGYYKDTSYSIMPGGPGYEQTYATTGIVPYLESLSPSGDLKAAFDLIAKHEQTLVEPLLKYLTDPEQVEKGVRVVGEEEAGLSRVPTISFVVVGPTAKKSKDIVRVFDEKGGVGIRYGHFYAYTLIDELEPKIDIADGVVRFSLVHYNTVEEVERIIGILKEILV